MVEIGSIGGLFSEATVSFLDTEDQEPQPPVVLSDTNTVEAQDGSYAETWISLSGESSRIEVEITAGETTWIRGSLVRFPQDAGEPYAITDLAGVTVWNAPLETGTVVRVPSGINSIQLSARGGGSIVISAQVQTLPGSLTGLEAWTAPKPRCWQLVGTARRPDHNNVQTIET